MVQRIVYIVDFDDYIDIDVDVNDYIVDFDYTVFEESRTMAQQKPRQHYSDYGQWSAYQSLSLTVIAELIIMIKTLLVGLCYSDNVVPVVVVVVVVKVRLLIGC